MRGGTSRAIVFHEKDLPGDRAERDAIFLKASAAPTRTDASSTAWGAGYPV